MKTVKLFSLLSVCASFAIGTAGISARAEMIEIGAGVRTASNGPSPTSALVRVQADVSIVYVRAELSFGGADDGAGIPYYDIRVTPLKLGDPISNGLRDSIGILPMRFSRNLQEGVTRRFEIQAVEVASSDVHALSESTALFAQFAVNAIGYKVQKYVEGMDTFHGFQLARGELEAGLRQNLGTNFGIRASVGGTADIAVGDSDGISLESELSAYARVTLSFKKYLRVFAQVSRGGTIDLGNDFSKFSTTLTAGAAVYF